MAQKVYLNNETIRLISLFEKITRSSVVDSFEDKNGTLIFTVAKDQLSKAIGKNAVNIKKAKNILKRKIRVIEYSDNIINFIKSLIFPLRIKDIIIGDYENLSDEEKSRAVITIQTGDTKTRGILIGRNASNLRNYESIVRKYFPVKEIKVV